MTIALVDPSGSGPLARERGGPAGEEQQARWRAELERAQWQSRLRYQAQRSDGRSAGIAPAAAAESAPLPAPGSDQASAGAVTTASPRPIVKPAAAVAPLSRQSTVMVTQRAAIASAEPTMTVVPGAARTDSLVARAAAAVKAATLPLPFAQFQWPASVTHASLHGNRLCVALRDSSIDERAAQELRERLQAQCFAWGLELGELTINGRLVEPVTSARD